MLLQHKRRDSLSFFAGSVSICIPVSAEEVALYLYYSSLTCRSILVRPGRLSAMTVLFRYCSHQEYLFLYEGYQIHVRYDIPVWYCSPPGLPARLGLGRGLPCGLRPRQTNQQRVDKQRNNQRSPRPAQFACSRGKRRFTCRIVCGASLSLRQL